MMKQGSIVALDTTRNLLESLSGHVLRLRLDGSLRLPGTLAERAQGSDDGYTAFELSSADEVESILHQLRGAGCKVREMELAKPDLEQAFIRIMQRS
jgi:ABC-2 type transport system ATP-binding protein